MSPDAKTARRVGPRYPHLVVLVGATGDLSRRKLAAAQRAEQTFSGASRRLHYLSMPPNAALSAARMLGEAQLIERSRVVMEKPFGTDLASAVALNAKLHEVFSEQQIFRIDHFLGKDARRSHALHRCRGHRTTLGKVHAAPRRSAAGAHVHPGQLGAKRNPLADRATRMAPPLRARLARSQPLGRLTWGPPRVHSAVCGTGISDSNASSTA